MATPSNINLTPLPGNLRFSDGGLAVDYLTGVFVKSVSPTGLVTFQSATGTETTAQLATGSGATVTSGTADPTGGATGDVYLQVNGTNVLQSIWRNIAGTWTEYTVPAGVALSDTAPRSVTTGANAAGTADEAARRDHHHQVVAATTTQAGITEYATDNEALSPSISVRAMTPASTHHMVDARATDDAPLAPATTAVAGSSTDFSRSDHVHPEGTGTNGITIQDSGVEEGTAIGTINFGDSLEVEVTGDVALVHGDAGSGMGVTLSDEYPVNIGPQSQQGSGDEAARDDHTHYLPHDTTLAFSAGTLGVNISDVVEHLSQNVRYYTQDGTNYSTDGSAAGQVYNTSRFPKSLNFVKASLRVPTGVSDAIYRAGAYIVDATRNITAILGQSAESGILTGTRTHRFDFLATATSALGIPLEGGERIMVLIRRVGAGNTAETGLIHGSEAGDSPDESYPDAGIDWVLANHVIIEHENPIVGQGTAAHGTDIRGNLQLGYTVTIDHGSLVGDTQNVGVNHINSGAAEVKSPLLADGLGGVVFERLPVAGMTSETATDGQVPTANGLGGVVWEDGGDGGSGTGTALARFRASLSQRTTVALEAAYETLFNSFSLPSANIQEQTAGFLLATDSTTVTIPVDGDYLVNAKAYVNSTGSERSVVYLRVKYGPSGTGGADDEVVLGSKYIRNQPTSETGYLGGTAVIKAVAGDLLHLEVAEETDSSESYTIGGNSSHFDIIQLPTSEGGGGSGQRGAGGAGLYLVEDIPIISSKLYPTEYGLGTTWGSVFDGSSPTFVPILPEDVDRIEVGFYIGSRYTLPMVITQAMIYEMGATAGIPTGAVAATTIKGAYLSGRLNPETDSREPMVINPKYGYMEDRRTALRYGILVGISQNADGEMRQLRIFVSANIEIDVEYATIVPRGAAV